MPTQQESTYTNTENNPKNNPKNNPTNMQSYRPPQENIKNNRFNNNRPNNDRPNNNRPNNDRFANKMYNNPNRNNNGYNNPNRNNNGYNNRKNRYTNTESFEDKTHNVFKYSATDFPTVGGIGGISHNTNDESLNQTQPPITYYSSAAKMGKEVITKSLPKKTVSLVNLSKKKKTK